MNKLTLLLPTALIFSGCTLIPAKTTSITGTEQQKAEKLGQIIASGGQADCQVTNLTDKTSTQIILSGKKIKFIGSDFGEGKKGTMLTDSVYTYIWSEGEKVGFKTRLEPEKATEPAEAIPQEESLDTTKKAESFDDDTKYKTECTRRSISESEFIPPADIEFTDFADMMKSIPQVPSIPAIPSQNYGE